MSLSEKMLWSTLITISLIFSLGGTLFIQQNHEQLLQAMIQQNLNQHLTNAYTLESNLLQETLSKNTAYGNDQEAMSKKAMYHARQLANENRNETSKYLLSDEMKHTMVSTLSGSLPSTYSVDQLSSYIIHDDQMYISSKITCADESYYYLNQFDVSTVFKQRDQQNQFFIILDIFMLVIAFIIIKYMTRYVLKPLYHLKETTTRIALGNYHERCNLTSDDEIGQLSKSFDQMAQANEETIHELQRQAQSKEEFMGSFAHEIKTPMTAILGFADMLRSYDCNEEERFCAADFIYKEGQRLSSLSYRLMELLSLSETNIRLATVSLDSLFIQLKTYYDVINQQHITFTYENVILKGEENLLFILMRNIIDNALKASHNTPVYVQGVHIDHQVILSVIDQGIGMSEEEVLKASEPFYMADASRSRTQGGAGLGLSLCQKICALHHTTLIIASTPSIGTSVRISLEADYEV